MELVAGFLFLVCLVELAFHAWERNSWSQERRELVQRLQAPELAVAAYVRGREGPPDAVAPIALDDDAAYEALRLERQGVLLDEAH